jgi:peptide methionine sulfoxide reductase msrA/msrB
MDTSFKLVKKLGIAMIIALSVINTGVAEENWPGYDKKESVEALRKRLSPLQFEVTQEAGTEKPFKNEFWNHHENGIYVDIVSGEPLFSSRDKFDSGTGWPSFSKPIGEGHIKESTDFKLLYPRTELRSKVADSHLGHVFSDGPPPTGKRYCINSAALRFIPVAQLKESGYGDYAAQFQSNLGTADKKETIERAIFAGGCFWCMEPPFEKLPGVIKVISGYTGGKKANPTYAEVSAGGTGHAEAVEVTFDRTKITYDELLDVFWKNIDPTAVDRQFVDVGDQYRSEIFFVGSEQQSQALASKKKLEDSKRFSAPIVTSIEAAGEFYPAEDYHQDYYLKNPVRYKYYRWNSGRDQFLEKVWQTKH